jgi:predicted nicotinamide N-methyase
MSVEGVLRQRNHLLARIHRQYDTREQFLQIGHLTLQFISIADPDRVLDDAAAAEESAVAGARRPSVPYWAELWDSATGLAQWLIERHEKPPIAGASALVRGLDLGCGMGLSGVCAAALGIHVTFADFETLPLLFARLNSLPWQQSAEVRRIDWRTDSLEERFHIILGADILYERAQWEFLDRFWKQHLTGDGLIVLGEPGRQTGAEFTRWIVERGWTLHETRQIVGPEKKIIRVLQLRRRFAGDATALGNRVEIKKHSDAAVLLHTDYPQVPCESGSVKPFKKGGSKPIGRVLPFVRPSASRLVADKSATLRACVEPGATPWGCL